MIQIVSNLIYKNIKVVIGENNYFSWIIKLVDETFSHLLSSGLSSTLGWSSNSPESANSRTDARAFIWQCTLDATRKMRNREYIFIVVILYELNFVSLHNSGINKVFHSLAQESFPTLQYLL